MKKLAIITLLVFCATVAFAQIKDLVDSSEKLWNLPKEQILANLHHLYEDRIAISKDSLFEVITFLSSPYQSTELYFKNNVLVAINHFYYGPNDTLEEYEQIALQEFGPPINGNSDNPRWVTNKSDITLYEARGSFVLLAIKEKEVE